MLSAFPTIGGDVDAYLSLTVNTNVGTVDLVSATHPALVSLLLKSLPIVYGHQQTTMLYSRGEPCLVAAVHTIEDPAAKTGH